MVCVWGGVAGVSHGGAGFGDAAAVVGGAEGVVCVGGGVAGVAGGDAAVGCEGCVALGGGEGAQGCEGEEEDVGMHIEGLVGGLKGCND